VNMQFLRRGITARPAKDLKVRSSLVRRLVQAQDDPAKHHIRAWLCDLDDEQLSSIGLTGYNHTRNFGLYGHAESNKTQKFVFRSVLRPIQISFSHDQDPSATSAVHCGKVSMPISAPIKALV
jgi:hypothetical protein